MPKKSTGGKHYKKRDWSKGPATYKDPTVYEKIMKGLRLRKKKPLILDVGSGPGKVGKSIQKLLLAKGKEPRIIHSDIVTDLLHKIESTEFRVAGDIVKLPFKESSIDGITARYTLKDLGKTTLIKGLKELQRVLKPGARLSICDMVSPEGDRGFTTKQHRIKHKLGGNSNPKHHIPTEAEWIKLLKDAGFSEVEIHSTGVSKVSTQDWFEGKQIDAEGKKGMDKVLMSAPKATKKALNIRKEGKTVKVDYPILFITAKK